MRMLRKNILRTISSDPTEYANMVFLLIRDALSGAAMIFASNAIIQSYLLKVGLSVTGIGIFGTTGNVASIAGILIFMGFTDRVVNRVRLLAITAIFYALTPLMLIGSTLLPGIDNRFLLTLLIAAGVLQNLALSLKNMLENKIFTRLIRMEICGRFLALDGVIVNVVSVFFSITASSILKALGFPGGFILLFICSFLLFNAAAFIIFRFKMLAIYPRVLADSGISAFNALPRIFKVREFRAFVLPNVLRGIAMGGSYFAMAVGTKKLNLPPVYSTYMVLWGTIAAVFSNILFGFLIQCLGTGRICLSGSIIAAIGLVCMPFAKSPAMFLAFYFLMLFGQTFVDQGVPTGVYKIVPFEIMGIYTGGRFLLMTGGTALSTMVIGVFIDSGIVVRSLISVAVIQVVSGFLFFIGFCQFRQKDFVS
ncbi:MAG: MFS transporter [Clostridiaceae bacterium]